MKYLIQENLQKNHSFDDLNRWFHPLDINFSKKDVKLTVLFPHAFFEPWFVEQGKNIFEQAVKNISIQNFGFIPTIEYSVHVPAKKKSQDFYTSFSNNKEKNISNRTFENFYYNIKNEIVIDSAQKISTDLLNPIYNPFVIYGKNGTGKTHILYAIYNNLLAFNKKIFIGTIKNFQDDLLAFGFKNFSSKFSAFIIDDFQYINNKEDFLEEIIQFIDFCIVEKKQLIFSTSLPLNTKKKYVEGLRSRLNMGLTVKLAKADIDVRMRFAISFCQKQNIKISKNQLLTIVQRCDDISFLNGILLKIKAFIDIYPEELNTSDIEKIFLSLGEKNRSISSKDIINITANYFNISKYEILEDIRQPHIVKARHIAMHLCRELLGLSYPSIGKIFGGKDHSTVMYSIKKIKLLIDKNKDTQNEVTKIKQKCTKN